VAEIEVNNCKPKRRPSYIGPLVLVGLGIIILLGNLGVVGWNAWEMVTHLWPLLLVAIGLDIFLSGRASWGIWITLLAAVFVIGIVASIPIGWHDGDFDWSINTVTESISQPLEGAKTAEIELKAGVNRLVLVSDASTGNLVEGTIALGEEEKLNRDFSVTGGNARYVLSYEKENGIHFSMGNNHNRLWNLHLNGGIPVNLTVNTGVGSSDVDLRQASVTGLKVSTGVGLATVYLPERGNFTAEIRGGVGKVRIVVPQGLAIRIHVQRGLGGLDVSGGLDEITRNEYVTPGYDTAKDKVELRVESGIGEIEIERE